MEELVKTVEFVSTKYDELLTKQNNLEAANVELQKENQLLKIQVFCLQNNAAQTSDNLNHLEHFGRRDRLEIWGIPVKREENTDELVRSVGDLIDAGIKPEDISISHRLTSKRSTPNSPPAITLKFVKRTVLLLGTNYTLPGNTFKIKPPQILVLAEPSAIKYTLQKAWSERIKT